MNDDDWLAAQFEVHRARLRAVAYRMLGSLSESDDAVQEWGASEEVRGAEAVANQFFGRAQGARPALVNGAVELIWSPGGRPKVVFGLEFAHGRISEIELIADSEHLERMDWVVPDRDSG